MPSGTRSGRFDCRPSWPAVVASRPCTGFARRLRGCRALLASLALLAVASHHVFFSQNARGYTASLLFGLLASGLLVRACADRPWWAGCSMRRPRSLCVVAVPTGGFVLSSRRGGRSGARRHRAPLGRARRCAAARSPRSVCLVVALVVVQAYAPVVSDDGWSPRTPGTRPAPARVLSTVRPRELLDDVSAAAGPLAAGVAVSPRSSGLVGARLVAPEGLGAPGRAVARAVAQRRRRRRARPRVLAAVSRRARLPRAARRGGDGRVVARWLARGSDGRPSRSGPSARSSLCAALALAVARLRRPAEAALPRSAGPYAVRSGRRGSSWGSTRRAACATTGSSTRRRAPRPRRRLGHRAQVPWRSTCCCLACHVTRSSSPRRSRCSASHGLRSSGGSGMRFLHGEETFPAAIGGADITVWLPRP